MTVVDTTSDDTVNITLRATDLEALLAVGTVAKDAFWLAVLAGAAEPGGWSFTLVTARQQWDQYIPRRYHAGRFSRAIEELAAAGLVDLEVGRLRNTKNLNTKTFALSVRALVNFKRVNKLIERKENPKEKKEFEPPILGPNLHGVEAPSQVCPPSYEEQPGIQNAEVRSQYAILGPNLPDTMDEVCPGNTGDPTGIQDERGKVAICDITTLPQAEPENSHQVSNGNLHDSKRLMGHVLARAAMGRAMRASFELVNENTDLEPESPPTTPGIQTSPEPETPHEVSENDDSETPNHCPAPNDPKQMALGDATNVEDLSSKNVGPSPDVVNGKNIRELTKDLVNFWGRRSGRKRVKVVESRLRMVRARIRDGYHPEDLFRSIAGICYSDFHKENGHDTFEVALRNGEQVEKGIRQWMIHAPIQFIVAYEDKTGETIEARREEVRAWKRQHGLDKEHNERLQKLLEERRLEEEERQRTEAEEAEIFADVLRGLEEMDQAEQENNP